jgi:hypothetical protein
VIEVLVEFSLIDTNGDTYKMFSEPRLVAAVARLIAGLPRKDKPPSKIRIIERRYRELGNHAPPSKVTKLS